MPPHHLVEGDRKLVARPAPCPDIAKLKVYRSEYRGIEILMRDRVPPEVQVFQEILPRLVAQIQVANPIPERQAETVEVRTKVRGIRIAVIELSILNQGIATSIPQYRRCQSLDEVIRAFNMKIPAVALEL